MKHLKAEFDKLTFREVVIFVMSWVCLIASYVVLFIGLLIPPEGEIHDSVLYHHALTLFFIAALLGITFHFNGEMRSFKRNILDFLKQHKIGLKEEASSSERAEDVISDLSDLKGAEAPVPETKIL